MMDFVVRVLDNDGRLRHERIMFHDGGLRGGNRNLEKIIKNKIESEMNGNEIAGNLSVLRKSNNKLNI